MLAFVRSAWRRFWRDAPRRLRATREGKVIIGLAFAVGFAAINTGNNLLFLGWGMLLAAVVLSGLLSESSLRIIEARTAAPELPRAGEPAAVPLWVENMARRAPAFGLEFALELRAGTRRWDAAGPFELRLPAREERRVQAAFVPAERGRVDIEAIVCRTAHPFGFFEKDRRFQPSPAVTFWVAPPAVDVTTLAPALLSRLGEQGDAHAGRGEDFFSLRPFREGDDPRRVHWRRTAHSGRRVVVESEAQSARSVELELVLGPGPHAEVEHAIAVFGSLAEALLAEGRQVGVRGPGTLVTPAAGARQRQLVLAALARMDPAAATPAAPVMAASIVLVGAGGAVPAAVDLFVVLPGPETRRDPPA